MRQWIFPRCVLGCALALVWVLVAGCGSGNPKPAPLPKSTASASPSTEAAPSMPAEAKGTTPDAAKAFVRYFITTLNYAQSTGETALMRQLYSASCKFCEGVSDGLDKIKHDGGHIETKGWTIRNLAFNGSRHKAQVLAEVDVSPQVVVTHRGGEAHRYAGQTAGHRRFSLHVAGDAWTITGLGEVR